MIYSGQTHCGINSIDLSNMYVIHRNKYFQMIDLYVKFDKTVNTRIERVSQLPETIVKFHIN